MANCELILSGFADEAANEKTIDQQFVAFSSLGLSHLSLRFIDVGWGIKNVMDLNGDELDLVRTKLDEYDLKISSIGSPIGKTKLLDVTDGTTNTFFDPQEYLDDHVLRACKIANTLDCKLLRGFSFYHPKNEDPFQFIEQSAHRLKEIAEACDDHGLTFGLEVEANLVGQNADILNQIKSAVNHDAVVLIFDGANLVTQGYSKADIIKQYSTMQDGLGWLHIKDHLSTDATIGKYVDEERLHDFVPAGEGESGYPEILVEFKKNFESILARAKQRGLPGIFADLEPHLRGGGQFGGFSGPDGFGVAVRSFCNLCDEAGIDYQLRDFQSLSS